MRHDSRGGETSPPSKPCCVFVTSYGFPSRSAGCLEPQHTRPRLAAGNFSVVAPWVPTTRGWGRRGAILAPPPPRRRPGGDDRVLYDVRIGCVGARPHVPRGGSRVADPVRPDRRTTAYGSCARGGPRTDGHQASRAWKPRHSSGRLQRLAGGRLHRGSPRRGARREQPTPCLPPAIRSSSSSPVTVTRSPDKHWQENCRFTHNNSSAG